MSQGELGGVETEFVRFWSERRGVSVTVVGNAYLAARERFAFEGANYHRLALDLYALFAPAYGQEHEADLIASHQFYSVLHAYKLVMREARDPGQYEARARMLGPLLRTGAVVVDYGSGAASASLALGQLRPDLAFCLVDVESSLLDFASARLNARRIPHVLCPVRPDNWYPDLPAHDLCLADLVMEELRQPLRAYEQIVSAMRPRGILVGRFGDWGDQFLRPSPDLSALRARVADDFERLPADDCYRRAR